MSRDSEQAASNGTDPLSVKDWSAYEKSMLEVLREERRGKSVAAVPLSDIVAPPQVDEHGVPEPRAVEASGRDTLPEPASFPFPAAPRGQTQDSNGTQEEQTYKPYDPVPVSSARPAQRPASRWRMPLVALSFVVCVAGAVGAIVKLDRYANRAPVSAVSQDGRIEEGPGIAVNAARGSVGDQDRNEYELSGDSVRLRRAPARNATVILTLHQGTSVKLEERSAGNEWCLVQLEGGQEGWLSCDFLRQRPVAEAAPARAGQTKP